MKADLKGISSIDLPDGTSLPANPKDCWILVTASIGSDESEAADDFTFYVCTPDRMHSILTTSPVIWGKRLLIVDQFDWATVKRTIDELCDRISGENWDDIARQLSYYALWEFSDYRS
ncbi:MAG: immunity 8 family protein [Thioalkalivibrio sp.]|nr:immunity 8 family protein [Thioalkalivibrio sp.]